MQSEAEEKRVFSHKELFIDIGAKNKKDAMKYVRPGDYVCFDTKSEWLSQDKIKAKALDDRIGCAIMLELLENNYTDDLYYVFCAQEEVDSRGAQAAVYNIAPDAALVIDTTPANDLPDVAINYRITELGGGVSIPHKDSCSITDPKLYEALRALAQEEKIRYWL